MGVRIIHVVTMLFGEALMKRLLRNLLRGMSSILEIMPRSKHVTAKEIRRRADKEIQRCMRRVKK